MRLPSHLILLFAHSNRCSLLSDTYNYAWSRVRDRAAVGFGKDEARVWHRRVYGGLVSSRPIHFRCYYEALVA